jgi:hypothetical protein
MHYKSPNNSVHFLDDDSFVHLLPAGSVAITEEEAEALRPVPPLPTVQDQLNKLDADNTLTQRNLRNTIMLMNEAFKLVSNNAVDLSGIPGVAKVYEVEAQAETLRSQL